MPPLSSVGQYDGGLGCSVWSCCRYMRRAASPKHILSTMVALAQPRRGSDPSDQCRLTLQCIKEYEPDGAEAAGNRPVGDLVLPSTARYSRGRPLASCFDYPNQALDVPLKLGQSMQGPRHKNNSLSYNIVDPLSADLFTYLFVGRPYPQQLG